MELLALRLSKQNGKNGHTHTAYDAFALPLIRKLDWPTINELIESETLKMVYKSVNNQALPFTLRKCSLGYLIHVGQNFAKQR